MVVIGAAHAAALRRFLDAAASVGCMLGGVDAAELYACLFGDAKAEAPLSSEARAVVYSEAPLHDQQSTLHTTSELQPKSEAPAGRDQTGWPPGMLQDDSRELSKWLASQPGASRLVREAAAPQPERRLTESQEDPRIAQLRNVLGPTVPTCLQCAGCHAEWADALRILATPTVPADRCTRCGSELRAGIAIEQTSTGTADFPGGEAVTMSPGGPGRLINCMKCVACGHSITSAPVVRGRFTERKG